MSGKHQPLRKPDSPSYWETAPTQGVRGSGIYLLLQEGGVLLGKEEVLQHQGIIH